MPVFASAPAKAWISGPLGHCQIVLGKTTQSGIQADSLVVTKQVKDQDILAVHPSGRLAPGARQLLRGSNQAFPVMLKLIEGGGCRRRAFVR
jgi:hypothetical protein